MQCSECWSIMETDMVYDDIILCIFSEETQLKWSPTQQAVQQRIIEDRYTWEERYNGDGYNDNEVV